MTNSQRLNCNEFRRGFLRLQGFGARTGQGCFEIADSQNRPVPEIRPNIQKKKNPKCHSQSQDWNTQKHTGPKPPCYRSFQKSASDSDSVLYRATRDSAQLGDSRLGRLGDSANPGPRGSRRGTWSGTDLHRRRALRWSTRCSTRMPHGPAGRHGRSEETHKNYNGVASRTLSPEPDISPYASKGLAIVVPDLA